MLEPRLIVRQSFSIPATRGPTEFKGRKGQARVRLARTSAGKVGDFARRRRRRGGGTERRRWWRLKRERGNSLSFSLSLSRVLYKLSCAKGEDPVGPPRGALLSGSAFRHLNAPRTPLPGLVSPSLFLPYFRVLVLNISSKSSLKEYGCASVRRRHTLATREVSSLFPIDLRICSLFDHGSFFLFDGSASRLPPCALSHRRVDRILKIKFHFGSARRVYHEHIQDRRP